MLVYHHYQMVQAAPEYLRKEHSRENEIRLFIARTTYTHILGSRESERRVIPQEVASAQKISPKSLVLEPTRCRGRTAIIGTDTTRSALNFATRASRALTRLSPLTGVPSKKCFAVSTTSLNEFLAIMRLPVNSIGLKLIHHYMPYTPCFFHSINCWTEFC